MPGSADARPESTVDPVAAGRIAAVIPAEGVSGPGRQLAALAAALRDEGWRTRIFVLWRKGRRPPPYAAFLDRLGLDHELIADHGPLDAGLVSRLGARLALWRPDVVQTHGYKATAVVRLMRSRAAWRWVGCYHGATAESRRARAYHRLDRIMLRRADTIVVMSAEQAALFGGRHGPVRVIHNAVIPMERSADPARAAVLDVTRAMPRPLVAYVGRLSHEKGVDVLIDALTILRSRGFGGALAIAGSGPEQQRLTVQASRAGLASALVFLGDVTAMDALYEVADVVVLPSRSEGLPNVLLEALFAGKAVVATRVGAVPDVLTLPAAGIVVPPEDAAALADAIALAVEHILDPAGRIARKTIADAFSVARRAAAHLEVYRSIVSDVRSAAV